MDVMCMYRGGFERRLGPGRHQGLGSRDSQHFEHIAGGLLERDIPVDRGDRFYGGVRRIQGVEEGKGIVDAAIGIDEEAGHGFRIAGGRGP
jgi:hypothetical protein